MGSLPDSLEIVLAYAREEYEQQHSAHDKVVGRASGLLGFVTALIGLAGLGELTSQPERWLVIAGVIALIAAAILFVRVARLREYSRTPVASVLEAKYLGKPQAETQKAVLKATLSVIASNKIALRKVRDLYQTGVILLALGAVAVGAAIIIGALR
jgi:cytochrome c biogenesis protein CcdA